MPTDHRWHGKHKEEGKRRATLHSCFTREKLCAECITPSLPCSVYDKVPELMEQRIQMHREQGFSGLLGGFQEEHQFLNHIGSNVVPEDHIARPMLAVMTHRIAHNPQWKWQEKARAVHKVAHLLMRGERFAQRTSAEH